MLEAAEVVCTAVQDVQPVIQPDEILDLLAGLVNKSLVVVEEKGEETWKRGARFENDISASNC